MHVERDNFWLCADCMQYAVNDELPPDTDESRDNEIRAGVHSLGPNLVSNFDQTDGENEFSTVRCDACKTHLAGYRARFATLAD